MKKFLSEYPKLIKEWHPTKNGDSRPEEFTHGSGKKVWWLCPKGHSYDSIISSRTVKKSNCPYCSNKRVGDDNNLLLLFPEIAKEWHPTKNGELTPNNFTHNAWTSDDGNFIFTTDERANAFVESFDISDLDDIKADALASIRVAPSHHGGFELQAPLEDTKVDMICLISGPHEDPAYKKDVVWTWYPGKFTAPAPRGFMSQTVKHV